jgi:DNA polymerase III subunit alpha
MHAGAEALLSVAAQAADARVSGQGGLFGGDTLTAPDVPLPRVDPWSLATRMAHEKEAFGFYLSAHPVERYRAWTRAMRARSFGELAASAPAPPGERRPATMAGMVESVRWRTSQRGNRYMLATLSDRSGQFPASCFDEGAAGMLETLATDDGCALMQVELDWREGEETPRVSVRSVKLLEQVAASNPLRLTLTVAEADAFAALAALLAGADGGRSEVVAMVHDGAAPIARVRLGGAYRIDSELAARIEQIAGVEAVEVTLASGTSASAQTASMTMH